MVIVITGASTGIGYQVALKLAAEGNTVFAIARRKSNLEQLEQETLKKKQDAALYILAGDISDEKFLDEVGKEITSKAKSVNVLINNAGMLVNKPFEALTAKDWKDVYATNVFSAVALTQKILPLFTKEVRGHILNISSMGGFQGSAKFAGLSAYSSSKAALVGLTECLAEELKEKNIAVNCLCLGSVQTEMFANAFPSFKAATTSEEMAKFIGGFALDGAKFFNGKIIPVSSTTP